MGNKDLGGYVVKLAYPLGSGRARGSHTGYLFLRDELIALAKENKGRDIQINLSEKRKKDNIDNLEFKASFATLISIDRFIHSLRNVCPDFKGEIDIKSRVILPNGKKRNR